MRTELWLAASLVLPPSLFAAAPHFEAGRKEDHGPGGRVLVRCDAGETIGRTLSRLEKWRPHSLNVSGTCHENLSIAGFDDLTIVGKTGAALVPVPPATAPAIDVSASRLVSIEGLTIRAGDDPWRAALTLAACQDCRLRNVTVDGGVGFWAVSWSHVTLSRFTLTGTGAYGIGVFHAKVDMEDSVLDGGAGSRQCGLCLFENAVAVVFRSEFKGFLVGVSASSGGQVTFWDHSTIEDNSCFGAQAFSGGQLAIHQGARILNNASSCLSGGVNLDSAAKLFIDQSEVKGNAGGGIVMNHQAFAGLGADTEVSGNAGSGLQLRNGSMAVAPGSTGGTIQVSGNSLDLSCDSISHINNGAQITGAVPPTPLQCPNFHAGDGPP